MAALDAWETGLEPVCYRFRLLQIIASCLFTSQIVRVVAACFSVSRRESSKSLAPNHNVRVLFGRQDHGACPDFLLPRTRPDFLHPRKGREPRRLVPVGMVVRLGISHKPSALCGREPKGILRMLFLGISPPRFFRTESPHLDPVRLGGVVGSAIDLRAACDPKCSPAQRAAEPKTA